MRLPGLQSLSYPHGKATPVEMKGRELAGWFFSAKGINDKERDPGWDEYFSSNRSTVESLVDGADLVKKMNGGES